MTPQEQQDRLMDTVNSFPTEVHNEIGRKDVDIVVAVLRICGEREWVLYETGGVCDGVRQVLEGELSPAELAGVIAKDAHIEEDNRVEIPEVAYDIQTRVFDVALPILKALGYSLKEGRVPTPPPRAVEAPNAAAPTTDNRQPITAGAMLPAQNASGPTTANATPPLSSPLKSSDEKDKYVRALARIAAGTTYSERQLLESFESLPLGLRQAIASVDTANSIQAIAKKNLLHVDQMSALASETGLVLLGLTHPRDYIANLGKRLRVPEAKARDIAKEVSGEVLSKVREFLRTLHESPATVQPAPEPAKQTPAPKPQTQSKLGILAEQAKAGLSTPYTPDATWKTSAAPQPTSGTIGPTGWRPGGTRPAAQPTVPKPVSPVGAQPVPTQPPTPVTPKPAPVPVPQVPPTSPVPAPTPRPSVPPPPSRQNPPPPTQSAVPAPLPRPPRVFKAPMPAGLQTSTPKPQPPTPPAGPSTTALPPQPASTFKARPASEGTSPSAPKPPPPDDFLSQKLSAPMGLPREEKKYTVDPYREPLE